MADNRATPVITGLGVIAPTGIGKTAHWQAVLAGKSGIGQITRFDPSRYPVKVGGEVPGFNTKGRVPNRLVPQTDHWTHMGLAAADDALADAGLDPATVPEYEMAVVTASSSGGTEFGQKEIERLWASGPQFVGAYQSIAWFYAATTGQISIRHGMRGPCGVISCEQAGGLDTLGQSRRLLGNDIRMVVAGGTDASLCPYGLSAQLSTGLLSERDDPTGAYLPFDADADGYVAGEGGAILIVERSDEAARRGARSYGSVLGYAATFDPPPGSPRPPGLRRAIEQALSDAGTGVDEIDVVFADATGTLSADRAEAEAINAVFCARSVPVTAPKTLTGRLYGGGAALDVATALLAMGEGVIPPTVGTTQLADGVDLDLVMGRPRPATLRTVLVLARGYGGFNAAVVLGR